MVSLFLLSSKNQIQEKFNNDYFDNNKHLDDYAMIVIRVIQQNSETLILKELRLVNNNTPFHQNIRFKANVIGISQIYIWVLDSYDTLIIYLLCKIARWS